MNKQLHLDSTNFFIFSIELLAGMLQKTLFGKNRPAYLNYASVGFVIGHEIAHGFDWKVY